MLEEIEEKAAELSNSIANMFFGDVLNKVTENQGLCVEGDAYAGYISSDNLTIHNDIDAHNADYFIVLNIENQSFEVQYRDFNIDKFKDTDNEGNEYIREIREWNDWYAIPDIELP